MANIGDGATGCGPVWEALNFAAMGQFRTLLDDEHRGGLPLIFFIINNFYAMGGQTIGETMGYEQLSRIGAGVNPENLHAETVDGMNPLAVADAVRRAKKWIAAGDGPGADRLPVLPLQRPLARATPRPTAREAEIGRMAATSTRCRASATLLTDEGVLERRGGARASRSGRRRSSPTPPGWPSTRCARRA